MCSITYVTLDNIVDQIIELGMGTLMAKVDIKQAYRIIPVHPDDRFLLGVQWQGEVLLDKVLPFGLRSAPIIFTAVADALQWIMVKQGVRNVSHYLDDFLTIGPPGSDVCQHNLDGIIMTCELTGTPLEVDKCEGPTPTITFLGLELDTINMEIRLPAAKLTRLQSLLKDWEGKRAGKKRDLLSLIGYLHHASKAIRQGRSFLRRLINLSTAVKPLDGYIRLNLAARSDIKWWSLYVAQWNGTSMMIWFDKRHPTKLVTSDASGSWGCGAFCDNLWIRLQWPASMTQFHISIKEMIPVVISAALWASQWSGQSVHFQSDNTSVVALINSGTSRDDTLMHLMRCLSFIMAKFNFVVSASHIKGSHNVLADALSRNDHRTFLSAQKRYRQFCTQAKVTPFPVNEHDLCSHLAQEKVSHSSIKGYLSAVRHLQISQGHPDPSMATMPKLEGVIKGIKSTQAKAGTPKTTRLPITSAILNSIRLQWQREGPSQDQGMLWAAATLCFFLLFTFYIKYKLASYSSLLGKLS